MNIELDNLDPVTAAELLYNESVLFASLVSKLADAEIKFKQELYAFMKENPEMPANKVKIRAESGELYAIMRRLDAEVKGKIEIIRSLKKFVRVKTEEWETSKNI